MTKKADLNRLITLSSSHGGKGRMKKILSKTFYLFHLRRRDELLSQGWKLAAHERFVTTALNKRRKELTNPARVSLYPPFVSFFLKKKNRTPSEKMQPSKEKEKKGELHFEKILVAECRTSVTSVSSRRDVRRDVLLTFDTNVTARNVMHSAHREEMLVTLVPYILNKMSVMHSANFIKRILGGNISQKWKRNDFDLNSNTKISMTPEISLKWKVRGGGKKGYRQNFPDNKSFSSPEGIPFCIQQSIEKSRPTLEVRKKRIARNTRLIPSVVRRRRGVHLALHPLILGARKKGRIFSESFSQELLESFYGKGGGRDARDAVHKIAEGNRSFLRFRWW